MDSNAIIGIQYAILAVRQALSEDDKYLDRDLLPQMPHSSKLSTIQRELRSIILFLHHLDHSHRPQSIDIGSRNLIVHRYIAFRARVAVIAVDCAISHLRHDFFWSSPLMTSTANLIINDARGSSEAFLTLLHERAVMMGNMSSVDLPNMVDFYVVMHKLGFLLRDLSHANIFTQLDTVTGINAASNNIAFRPPTAIPLTSSREIDPDDTEYWLAERMPSLEADSQSYEIRSDTPESISGNGTHDGKINHLAHEVTSSIPPCPSLQELVNAQHSAQSLNLAYRFRPQSTAWSPKTSQVTTTKSSQRSRHGHNKRHRHRKFSVKSEGNTSSQASITDHQSSRARRNATIAVPIFASHMPNAGDGPSTRPESGRRRIHTVSQYLLKPPYPPLHRADQNVAKVPTATSSGASDIESHGTLPKAHETSLGHDSLDHESLTDSITTAVPTSATAKDRRRAKRRLARKLNRRLKAREREATAQGHGQPEGEATIKEPNAVTSWQAWAEERQREQQEWESESEYGSSYE